MQKFKLSEFFHKGLANNFAVLEFDGDGYANAPKLFISLSNGAYLYHKGDKDGHKAGPFKKGAMVIMEFSIKGPIFYYDDEDLIQ